MDVLKARAQPCLKNWRCPPSLPRPLTPSFFPLTLPSSLHSSAPPLSWHLPLGCPWSQVGVWGSAVSSPRLLPAGPGKDWLPNGHKEAQNLGVLDTPTWIFGSVRTPTKPTLAAPLGKTKTNNMKFETNITTQGWKSKIENETNTLMSKTRPKYKSRVSRNKLLSLEKFNWDFKYE